MAYGIREGEKEALEVEKEAKFGVWKYYTNEEGKARWRCSVCGHVVKHDPNDFKRCACGAHMSKEA
jgi:rubrerythrin